MTEAYIDLVKTCEHDVLDVLKTVKENVKDNVKEIVKGVSLVDWIVNIKFSQMKKVLEYIDQDCDLYIYSAFQTSKTLVQQLIACYLLQVDHNVIIVMDINIKQAETFLFRWVILKAEIKKELNIDIPMIYYMGDYSKSKNADIFPGNSNIILCLRSKQIKKLLDILPDDIPYDVINDEYHMLHRSSDTTQYVKYITTLMSGSSQNINITATFHDAIYDKTSKFDLDLAKSYQFLTLDPPTDHHGIYMKQWEIDTPDDWATKKEKIGIMSIDPYFDKIYDKLLNMSDIDRKNKVISFNNGIKLLNYPTICLFTGAIEIADQNTVFSHVLQKKYPNTVILTYNSGINRLFLPDFYEQTISIPVLNRILDKNKFTIGMSYKDRVCILDDGYYLIDHGIVIQNIMQFIYDMINVNGLRVNNIFIITGDLGKQGQSFCSYEQFPDFVSDEILFSDGISFRTSPYKLEINHLRVIHCNDIPLTSQKRGRGDGRSNIMMERVISTTPSIKFSLLDGHRRQLLDLKRAEKNVNKISSIIRTDIACTPPVFITDKPKHKLTVSGKDIINYTKVTINNDKLKEKTESCISFLKRTIILYVESDKKNTFKTAKDWLTITGLCGFKNKTSYHHSMMTYLVQELFLERNSHNQLRLLN
jgi:hypothetical protein